MFLCHQKVIPKFAPSAIIFGATVRFLQRHFCILNPVPLNCFDTPLHSLKITLVPPDCFPIIVLHLLDPSPRVFVFVRVKTAWSDSSFSKEELNNFFSDIFTLE
jgi:hypothetical protein